MATKWTEPKFSLKKLYHPGKLMGGKNNASRACPCGCNNAREWSTCEQPAEKLGIRNTPAMREIARLEKARRAAEKAAKVPTPPKPWKGAKCTGQMEIKIASEYKEGYNMRIEACDDPACTKEHLEATLFRPRCHCETREVREYRHPSGAVARVIQGKKVKGF